MAMPYPEESRKTSKEKNRFNGFYLNNSLVAQLDLLKDKNFIGLM